MNKCLVVFFILLFSLSFTQENTDKVILRNGDIINGVIVEDRNDQFIRIEVYGGSILTFEYSFIYKVERRETGKEIYNNTRKVYSNKYPSNDGGVVSPKQNCFDNEIQIREGYWHRGDVSRGLWNWNAFWVDRCRSFILTCS